MRILVTGGAGFIGSNFIRYILNKYPDYKITNLDKLTYCGNLENLKDIENSPNYKFVKGDICDKKIVDKLAKDIDIIVNFAAQTHVDKSIVDASEFIHTNVYGVYVLLEVAKKYNVNRFIHISSDEVYGSIEEGSFTEESPLRPNSPYAASKAAADHLVRSYFVTYKLPVLIIRSSNNFGQFQYPEKVIPLFITNALENKELPLYGDGLNIRDWLYVLDNCQAIDFILHKGEIGQIYNVAAGNEKTNLELTKLILKIMDKSENLI
jgi:dTDP-glucose 4,6-dehydratase